MITAGGMGFSLNPIKAVKNVAKTATHVVTRPISTVKNVAKGTVHVVATGAKATGHGIAVGAKATGHGVAVAAKAVAHGTMTAAEFTKNLALAPVKLALKPIKSRVNTLTNRRAVKLAWDRRKSKQPTPAERAEARNWTKSELKKKLPHGPLLALLAGSGNGGQLPSDGFQGFGYNGLGEPATATLIALIPVFMALMNALLNQFAKNGQAPVQIGPDGSVVMPPGIDPTQPDPSADVAAESDAMDPAVAAAAAGDDGGGALVPAGGGDDGGGGALVPAGGGGGGMDNHIMKWGAIGVGAVLLIMLLKPKSDGGSAAKK